MLESELLRLENSLRILVHSCFTRVCLYCIYYVAICLFMVHVREIGLQVVTSCVFIRFVTSLSYFKYAKVVISSDSRGRDTKILKFSVFVVVD